MRRGLLLLVLLLAGCGAPPQEDPAAAAFAQPRLAANAELVRRGDVQFDRGDLDGARSLYAEAVKTPGTDVAHVEACAQLARVELLQGTPLEGRPWLNMAEARARVEAPVGWSRLQLVIALYEIDDAQYEVATQRLEALYDYCLDAQLFERALDAARQAARLGVSREVQLEWARKGVAAAEKGGLYLELAALWNELGERLQAEGRSEDAALAFDEARRYREAAEAGEDG